MALDDTAARNGTLRVFLVHGMSNHPYGPENRFTARFGKEGEKVDYSGLLEKLNSAAWRENHKTALTWAIMQSQFTPLIPKMVKALGFDESKVKPSLEWFEDGGKVIGYQLQRHYNQSIGGRTKRLSFYVTSWAHTCLKPKLQLRKFEDYGARKHPIVNKAIKDGLVTWGLMDAALYVGANRRRMERPVALGIAAMTRDLPASMKRATRDRPDRFVFFSASLGSIICLNTLTGIAGQGGGSYGPGCEGLGADSIAAIFADQPPLHMLANQIPLLAPAVDGYAAAVKSTAQVDSKPTVGNLEPPQVKSLRAFARALARLAPSAGPDFVKMREGGDPVMMNREPYRLKSLLKKGLRFGTG